VEAGSGTPAGVLSVTLAGLEIGNRRTEGTLSQTITLGRLEERIRIYTISIGPDGVATVEFQGRAGSTYAIESSKDFRTWTEVGSVSSAATIQAPLNPGSGGAFEFFRI
jgi:hypothetical protein